MTGYIGYDCTADSLHVGNLFGIMLLRLYQRSGLQALVRRTGLLRLLGLADAEGYLPRLDAPFLVPRGQTWEPRPPLAPPTLGGNGEARGARRVGVRARSRSRRAA